MAKSTSASDLQAKLEALSTVGAGNVKVTQNSGGPFRVEFVGALSGRDVANLISTVPEVSIIENPGGSHFLSSGGGNAAQSQYSLYVTGKLTTLRDNQELQLAADGDVLIRGDIDLQGQGADLAIQSDGFVFLESTIRVPDQLRIYGGVKLDRSSVSQPRMRNGASVYINPGTLVEAFEAGAGVEIRGAGDVDLLSPILAGRTSQSSIWNSNGTITVVSGQQVYLDSGLLASKLVRVEGGTPGADDSGQGVYMDTAAGINAAGTANHGGQVEILSKGGVTNIAVGGITSGAPLDAKGDPIWPNRTGNNPTAPDHPGTVLINAEGPTSIGGTIKDPRDPSKTIDIGGSVQAKTSIDVRGNSPSGGTGVRVFGGSRVTTEDANGGFIRIVGTGDVDVSNYVIPGGRVALNAGSLPTPTYYNGTSQLIVRATEQALIRQTLQAGQRIDIVGGEDPKDGTSVAGVDVSGRGIMLLGTSNVTTTEAASQIVLSSVGPIHQQVGGKIEAQGTGSNVTIGGLGMELAFQDPSDATKFVMKVIRLGRTLSDNAVIGDLVQDIHDALSAATWTKQDGTVFGGTAPSLTVENNSGTLRLKSDKPIRLLETSGGAEFFGFAGGSNRRHGIPNERARSRD